MIITYPIQLEYQTEHMNYQTEHMNYQTEQMNYYHDDDDDDEEIIEDEPEKTITVAYLGAFSPPTTAHKDSANKIAHHIATLHPNTNISILFVPSNDAESKASINKNKKDSNVQSYMSFDERVACLCAICEALTREYSYTQYKCSFLVSCVEQSFTQCSQPITSKAICTMYELTKSLCRPYDLFYLAIGADNMANILDWSHALAIHYTNPAVPDPITSTQLDFLGCNTIGHFYQYLSGILVLDRMQTNGKLVSDSAIGDSIEGMSGTVSHISYFTYTNCNKPISLVRTTGWGRTDIPNSHIQLSTLFNSFPLHSLYLLDAPEPYGISSTLARTHIQRHLSLDGIIPLELLGVPEFFYYSCRVSNGN